MWYLPITEKETEQGGNELYHFGVTEMQGWRPGMEDMHTVSLHVDEERPDSNAFFAVYDGHGGTVAAEYAHENLHKRLTEDPAYRNQEYRMALKNAFLSTDEGMRNSSDFQEERHKQSGCTAISALLTKNCKIFVANAGDSRAVLSVKGMAKKLSVDHKPRNSIERSRIKAAGGYVSMERIKAASGYVLMERVNGDLSLTRALGDFRYKDNALLPPEAQIITADPEITEHDITDDDEFLVVACDGIWECLGSQKVVNAVRLLVSEGNELSEVCERICDLCLAPDTRGYDYGFDNMTIIVVALLHGRTIDEWYEWITDRTRRRFGFNIPTVLPRLYRR
ncbi:protein phosphatase 2C [Wolfiporia cocos MD-104 SS10]|uniref:protein-serine/threonine phosphatase n=1 Tax=Wolfiporia cocos (strain MD-104) TaxID=742152 RepID=A0A2H3JCR3_WOLCO|nr:protein phosphatase 2C [Wolfiporia cocos MD-104 SS10]